MSTQITYKKDDVELTVESAFKETIKGFPFSKNDELYHNHFVISVANTAGITESFDYYGSYSDYCERVIDLPDSEIRNALGCIISDALSGMMDFNEFCDEYGYDNDSRNAERIHKACIDTKSKIELLGITEDEMYIIVNDINEDC